MGNGTDTFTYAYTTNSSLLASVTKSGTPTIQTTHTWEPNRNVLDVKENKVGSTVISSYDYSVNALGQRTAVDTAGTAFAAGERDRTWSYDALGQVTAESDANNTAYHRGFAYDAIGNRLSSIEGNTDPTQPGATTYTPTVLNQYTQISAPSVPSVVPTYDADGNQLASQIRPLGTSSLASCLFVWDGENRLIEIKDATGTNSLAKYTYDSQSRRIARTVGGTTLATIYDGWNPIAEYQSTTTPATAFTLHATYLWGLDLSGSMQGAGGVGGLLSVTSGSTSFYPTYDGNGNVGEYLDAAGAIAAHYEYDAFGNVIFSSGASAASFQHRFSTKPQDAESGLYYYGYRYYDPLTGRWPSRDPIEERGGANLYEFIGNRPIGQYDWLGLAARCCCVEDVSIDPDSVGEKTRPIEEPKTLSEKWSAKMIGHRFTVVVKSTHRWAVGKPDECGCRLEWWEWSSMPLPYGENKVREWVDAALPEEGGAAGIFDSWKNGGEGERKITDEPAILKTAQDLFGKTRHLFIMAKVSSGTSCECKNESKKVYFYQKLTLKPKDPGILGELDRENSEAKEVDQSFGWDMHGGWPE